MGILKRNFSLLPLVAAEENHISSITLRTDTVNYRVASLLKKNIKNTELNPIYSKLKHKSQLACKFNIKNYNNSINQDI